MKKQNNITLWEMIKGLFYFILGQRYIINYKPYNGTETYTYIVGVPTTHYVSKAGNKLFISWCFSGRDGFGHRQFRYDRITGGLSPV